MQYKPERAFRPTDSREYCGRARDGPLRKTLTSFLEAQRSSHEAPWRIVGVPTSCQLTDRATNR